MLYKPDEDQSQQIVLCVEVQSKLRKQTMPNVFENRWPHRTPTLIAVPGSTVTFSWQKGKYNICIFKHDIQAYLKAVLIISSIRNISLCYNPSIYDVRRFRHDYLKLYLKKRKRCNRWHITCLFVTCFSMREY